MKKLLYLFLFLFPFLASAQPNVPTVWTISDSGATFYIIQAPVGYSAVNYYVRKAGASIALTTNDSVVLTGTVSSSSLKSKVGNQVRFAFYKNSGGYLTYIGYPLYSASNPFQVYSYLNSLLMTGNAFITLNAAGGTILKHNAGTLNNFTIDSTGDSTSGKHPWFGLWDGWDTTGVYLGGFTTYKILHRQVDIRFKKGLYCKLYTASPGRISLFFNSPLYTGM